MKVTHVMGHMLEPIHIAAACVGNRLGGEEKRDLTPQWFPSEALGAPVSPLAQLQSPGSMSAKGKRGLSK